MLTAASEVIDPQGCRLGWALIKMFGKPVDLARVGGADKSLARRQNTKFR